MRPGSKVILARSLFFRSGGFRSCLKLYRQVFYRARIECLFIFKGRIAGYVTAQKKETGIIEHKKRRNYQLL